MNDLSNKTVVGLGELLWDCFGDARHPGGAPANVAFHAAQLGFDGVICSRVGCDEPGDGLLAYLEQRGLSTAHVQRDHDHPTSTVTVDAARPDHPVYTIHESVAWDYLAFDDTVPDLARRAAAIWFGTLAQRSPRAQQTILAALEVARTALKVFDVNLRAPHYRRETIVQSLKHADVLKLNLDEALILAPWLGLQSADPAAFAREMIDRHGVRRVFITRGAKGCLAVSPTGTADVPGERVSVVDAVGAGDAFTAAMTYGLLHDWPLERTARFANAVGALVAGRAGAMPALHDELQELLATA